MVSFQARLFIEAAGLFANLGNAVINDLVTSYSAIRKETHFWLIDVFHMTLPLLIPVGSAEYQQASKGGLSCGAMKSIYSNVL